MSIRHRVTRLAVAGVLIGGSALAAASQAAAQPPAPVPPPPPVGPPPVPQIPPIYGQGQTPGPFGLFHDMMQTFNGVDPINGLTMPNVVPAGPPPGAGPSPPLPPGTISLTAPHTSTAVLPGGAPVAPPPGVPGPPLPPPPAPPPLVP